MSLFDEIALLFERKGNEAYLGEPLSQTEHALQAANLARIEGASAPLVVAALLHDIGHLLEHHVLEDDSAARGVDARHEEAGASWLACAFGPEVAEPVRLHVAAKRFLCAVDEAYTVGLSAASLRSLALQGGPFAADDLAQFMANPFYEDAVRLRRWDDGAKVPGRIVHNLEYYRESIESVALDPQRSTP
jgi:phosphonate degradation associated HDIG domain protein